MRRNLLFYLCEVLISEARVECNGVIGIGMIQGIEEEKSICIGSDRCRISCTASSVKELEEELRKKAKQQEEEMRIRREGIEKTKVNSRRWMYRRNTYGVESGT